MKKLKITSVILLLVIGCATYSSKMELSRDLYYEGRYEEALASLSKLVDDSSNNDRYLFFLERGKINLALGEYDAAITDLRAAEERFSEIEATVSVGDLFKNILINPGHGEYQPESHEKILINSYLLLAYWLGGDREGAFVERKRIVGRLKQYLGNFSEEDRETLDVPFARYLAALLYEVEGLEEDAAIEYRQVDKLCPEVPRHDVNPRLTELALFIEAGRAPVKVSREIRGYLRKEGSDLVGFFTFPDGTPPIFFRTGVSPVISIDNPGVLFTFAFPDYVRQERLIYSCRVVIDGIEAGEAVPLDLIEETALSAFKKKLGMILLKSAFRTYVKTLAQTKLKKKGGGVVDILGKVLSAVDKADTRSWQTLPAEIDLYRMEVTAGSHEVYVKFIGEHGGVLGESEKVTFSLEKGKKQIVYIPGPV